MASPRLTKAALRARCEAEILHLRECHKIDPAKGIEQLDGRNREAIIAWGKIAALKSIMEAFSGTK